MFYGTFYVFGSTELILVALSPSLCFNLPGSSVIATLTSKLKSWQLLCCIQVHCSSFLFRFLFMLFIDDTVDYLLFWLICLFLFVCLFVCFNLILFHTLFPPLPSSHDLLLVSIHVFLLHNYSAHFNSDLNFLTKNVISLLQWWGNCIWLSYKYADTGKNGLVIHFKISSHSLVLLLSFLCNTVHVL